MTEIKFRLSMAANVLAPCAVTLEELGYSVSNKVLDTEEIWIAEKDENKFSAHDPCQLLGLVKLIEIRGKEWRISDEQIKE